MMTGRVTYKSYRPRSGPNRDREKQRQPMGLLSGTDKGHRRHTTNIAAVKEGHLGRSYNATDLKESHGGSYSVVTDAKEGQ